MTIKYKFIGLRLKEDEYRRYERAAKLQHLKPSTWVKQTIEKEIERMEGGNEEQHNGNDKTI